MTERTVLKASRLDDDAISITSTQDEGFSSGEEFLVERVLAEKTDAHDRVVYLIFWAGYAEAESTWEPRNNIQDPAILEAWEERKADEARGAEPAFDVAGFDARAAEIQRAKVERHQRRKAKRRRLGIPVSPSASDTEGRDNVPSDSDSSEAVESNELPDAGSAPRRKSGQRLRRRSDARLSRDSGPQPSPIGPPQKLVSSSNGNESSDSSDLDRDPFVGDRKKAQRKALDAIRRRRIAPSKPEASKDEPVADRAVQPTAEAPAHTSEIAVPPIAQQLPGTLESSAQSRAQTAPEPAFTRIPKQSRRDPQPVGTTRSPSTSQSAVRGRGSIRGGGHLSRRNVFERGEPPKKRRTLIETASDPNQEQRLFANWHMRRKAELAGRSVADSAPDVAALGGLFDPSDPASFQPLKPGMLRKRPSLSASQPSDDLQGQRDAAVTESNSTTSEHPASTSTRPAWVYHRHGDNAVCYFWFFRGECLKGSACRFMHSTDTSLPIVPPPGKSVLSAADQETARHGPRDISGRRTLNEICFYWSRLGTCSKGSDCSYVHDNSYGLPVAPMPSAFEKRPLRQSERTEIACKFWLRGFCYNGDRCAFSHAHGNIDSSDPVSQPDTINRTSYTIDDPDPIPTDDVDVIDRENRSERPDFADGALASDTHLHPSNAEVDRNSLFSTEKANTMGAIPRGNPTRLSLEEYRKKIAGTPVTNRVKEIIFGHNEQQSLVVDFGDLGQAAREPWGQIFSDCPAFRFDRLCTSYDFQKSYVDIQRVMLWGGNLITNPADVAAADNLNMISQYLRIYCGGLVSVLPEFTILIYPAMEEWKTIAAHSGFSPEDRVRYLIFRPAAKIHKLAPVKGEAPPLIKKTLTKTLHDLRYKHFLHPDNEAPHHFYLMFPSHAKSTANFFASWLRSCSLTCKVYSSETEGSWNFFVTDASIKVGVVLIHGSAVLSIPEIPSLIRLTATTSKAISFWCVNDSGEQHPIVRPPQEPSLGQISVTRLFPHGHAILLTPSFLVAEPERVLVLISWFREKLKRSTPGTYKLVCAYDIRAWLLGLANEKTLERDEFMEQNHDKPAKDAMAGKRGLSYQACENRYKCHELLSGIIEDGTTNAFTDPYDSDEMVTIEAPIVFADSSIDPDDEHLLIPWFASWAVKNADKFRKFTVVGTSSSSCQSAVRMRHLMNRGITMFSNQSTSDLSKEVSAVSISQAAAGKAPVSLNEDTGKAPMASKTSLTSGSSSLTANPIRENRPLPGLHANAVDKIAEMDVSSDADGALISRIRAVDPESTPDLLLFCSATGCDIRTAQEYLTNADNTFQRALNLYSTHNRGASAAKMNIDAQTVELIDNVKAEQARQLPQLVTEALAGLAGTYSLPANSPSSAISPAQGHNMSPTWNPLACSSPQFSGSGEDGRIFNFSGFKMQNRAKIQTAGLSSTKSKAAADNDNGSRRGSAQSDPRDSTKKRRVDEVAGSAATSRDASRRGSYSTPSTTSPLAERMDIDSPQRENNTAALSGTPATAGRPSDTSRMEFRYGSTTAWYRNLATEGKGWKHIYVDSWDKCFEHIGL